MIQSENPQIKAAFDQMMAQMLNMITQQHKVFQMMEVCIDFVWKLYTRVPACREWLKANTEKV
jgi:hypothetical protein